VNSLRDIRVGSTVAARRIAETPSAGRLIAIVVGVDEYREPSIRDLKCAVNDAESVANSLRQTQPAELLDLTMAASPAREPGAAHPDREGVLRLLRRAASLAGDEDTVLLFFAGHGTMIGGHPCFLPADAALCAGGEGVEVTAALRVDEVQAAFADCKCRRRVMFLDCCQNSFVSDQSAESPPSPLAASWDRSVSWRTGMPVSNGLVDAFAQLPKGWSILLACGPNELSLEDCDWGEHGVFSHFLAAGLRGQADLDGDGIVSLAELSQFLADRIPKQARAVLEDLAFRGETMPGQPHQTPTIIWGGPVVFPLTQANGGERNRFQPGILRLALRFLGGPLPYPLTVPDMARYGLAVLYATAMALTALGFSLRRGESPEYALALGIGLVSALLWIAAVALAVAANESRWHRGGYVTGWLALAWHVAVFWLLAAAGSSAGAAAAHPAAAMQLGIELFLLLALLVVFGFNVVQAIVSTASLVKREERVVLRRAFTQLDRMWIHAELPNAIAMVSAHTKLYQFVGLGADLLILAHACYLLAAGQLTAASGVALGRDIVLFVLIQWQGQGDAANYNHLRRLILPVQ
jgi:hypothetical protein